MERIKENLATFIVLAIFGPAVGWFLGTSQTAQIASDVAEIKKSVAELKASGKSHDTFDNCTDKRLALIEAGVKRPADCAKGE